LKRKREFKFKVDKLKNDDDRLSNKSISENYNENYNENDE